MKKAYIELDGDNIVVGWSLERYSDKAVEIDYPEDFYGKLGFVKYVNGLLSIDEAKKEEMTKDIYTVPKALESISNLEKNVAKGQGDIAEAQEAIAELYEMMSSKEEE